MDEAMFDYNLMDRESDKDLALALQLHYEQLDREGTVPASSPAKAPRSIIDATWEKMDPNPDVRALFLEFNAQYFWGKLDGVEVRWSPRMTLCAGLCCYEGRGGLCSIRLSEPLLKLRPRKDLVETLLHEMIHAFLFITHNNKDHDDHGPEFRKHMNRLNAEAGTNISVYHNFHDEVDFYRKHWWKCDGRCQKWHPYYGIVRRAMNRPPSPRDTWWAQHQQSCGGTFTKIKEPEGYKAPQKRKSNDNQPANEKRPKTESSFVAFSGTGHTLGGTNARTPLKPIAKGSPGKNRPSVSSARHSSSNSDNLRQVDLTNFFAKPQNGVATQASGSAESDSSNAGGSAVGPKRGIAAKQKHTSRAEKAKHFMKDLFADILDDDFCEIVDDDESSNTVKSEARSSGMTDVIDVERSSGSRERPTDEVCSCPVCHEEVKVSTINEHLDSHFEES